MNSFFLGSTTTTTQTINQNKLEKKHVFLRGTAFTDSENLLASSLQPTTHCINFECRSSWSIDLLCNSRGITTQLEKEELTTKCRKKYNGFSTGHQPCRNNDNVNELARKSLNIGKITYSARWATTTNKDDRFRWLSVNIDDGMARCVHHWLILAMMAIIQW